VTPRKPMPSASLRQRSALRVVFYTLRTWALIVIAIAAAIYFQNFAISAVAFLLVGVLQYHLNILGHDGLHYSLTEKKWSNDLFCRLFLHGPQFAPLSLLRRNHLLHHRVLGQDHDPDRNYYRIERFASRKLLGAWLFFSFAGGNTFPLVLKLAGIKRGKIEPGVTQPEVSARVPLSDLLLDGLSILLTQGLIALAIFLYSGSWINYLIFWFIPLFSVMFGLNTLRSCLEHAEIVERDSGGYDRYNSFYSNPVERFVLSPFSMNCHAEHHYWPTIPFWKLNKARAELQSEEKYSDFHASTKYHTSYTRRLFQILRADS
jgi:fatty acid desaturase